MKNFYSVASVKGTAAAKNTGNFYINGAFRPWEEESLKYSSISIRDLQLYAVMEEKAEGAGARFLKTLERYDSPDFFRNQEEFLKEMAVPGEKSGNESPDQNETPEGSRMSEVSYALLLLMKSRLFSVTSGDAAVYRIRKGEIELLEPEASEGDSLPEDLYILCSGGMLKALPPDRIFSVAAETDRIQEIASALQNAASEAGCEESVSVLAIRRES